MKPTDSELARLVHKYTVMADLRARELRGEPKPPRTTFRALSAEFPGFLHELDRLPVSEIARRLDDLARASRGGLIEGASGDWMEWMVGYHDLMRAALRVKRKLGGRRKIAEEEANAMATLSQHPLVDPEFVHAVANPPAGRIAPLVFAKLAAQFGVSPETLRTAIFGRRKSACDDSTEPVSR